MTKKQKIWMWIFIAMFAIPEILWSPITNILFSFFSKPINGAPSILRSNVLFDYGHDTILKTVILVQLIGSTIFTIFWFKNIRNVSSKVKFWIVALLGLIIWLISMSVFYLVFIFNPNF